MHLYFFVKGTKNNSRIENNYFHKCSGFYGGAVKIHDQNVIFFNNTFSSCSASMGGSLFMECPSLNCFWNLTGR